MKPRQCCLSIFVILVGFFASNNYAQHHNTVIRWQTYNTPPNFIQSGEFKGQGFVEQLLKMIVERMPEYQHKFEVTSQNRALENIKSAEPVCHPSLVVTPERKHFIHFSQPILVSPTNRLIVRKNFFHGGSANLRQLLNDKKISFALLKNRSFGKIVDETIAMHKNRQRILLVANENSDYLFNLIAASRIDATIGYESELMFFSTSGIGEEQSALISLPIEGNQQYVLASIGCAKTPWGKEIVKGIDQAMQTLKLDRQFQQKMTRWWQEERRSKSYWEFYQHNMLEEK